jgi:hypothetical protein
MRYFKGFLHDFPLLENKATRKCLQPINTDPNRLQVSKYTIQLQ